MAMFLAMKFDASLVLTSLRMRKVMSLKSPGKRYRKEAGHSCYAPINPLTIREMYDETPSTAIQQA
jgi:hypothetical protein